MGKRELAKNLTELVFGDERAYIRFDMSEFAEEHTGRPPAGAPPGYTVSSPVATDMPSAKTFSVVLFDEIEKPTAHLDNSCNFEDGLTDGPATPPGSPNHPHLTSTSAFRRG